MAAFFFQKNIIKCGGQILVIRLDTAVTCATGQIRTIKHNYKRPKPLPCLNDMAKSIAQKGYLRAQDSYNPPKNVARKIQKLLSNVLLSSTNKLNREDKFTFLKLCESEFGRAVPSSLLHEVNSINDVITFYETPINAYLPLDELRTKELPPNLHIQHEYVRFHPDTDTMFNGKSAFPGSSTIVTGLKARKKYAGFVAKKPWPC